MTGQGWAIPDAHPLAHFFVGGESLCRQWKYAGPVDATGHPALNCRRCNTLASEVASSDAPTVPMVLA